MSVASRASSRRLPAAWAARMAAAAPAVVMAWLLLACAVALWAPLPPAQRDELWRLLEGRLALVLMLWCVSALALGAWVHSWWLRHAAAPGRMAEQLTVLLNSSGNEELPAERYQGSSEVGELAQAVNALIRQRAALRADFDAQVQQASREIEQERNRLAALMAELTQSVVVCNLDGRVLLFNARARLQFRALADGPNLGGAQALALGRSIHAVLDRKLVAHALESVQARLLRGAPNPTAQFVTSTRGGQLLRVQLAPVRAVQTTSEDSTRPLEQGAADGLDLPQSPTPPRLPTTALAGYVLMLDNITRDFADESARDQLIHQFTEASRASLGSLQAAVELLEEPELDLPTRERFQGVVREEAGAMAERIQQLAQHTTQTLKTRWPLEEMLGADLVAAAVRRIGAQAGCRADVAEVDASLWLKVDSFSLIQTLAYLAQRLADEYDIKRVQLRLQAQGARAQLDLIWFGQAMSTETVMGWETDAIRVGQESSALTVRDVVQRHGGAFWLERERVRQAAFFRFLLPLSAESTEPLDSALVMHSESRPEFYDFDLFKAGQSQSHELADRLLAELGYTVFDTETTGLDPSGGDEIIQIGATRVVAGKLRRQDCFEQLIDPQRSLPAASVAIHGIQPEMVKGQPTIAVVLPAFHAFAADSVFVAHNAAFDMRFLQLKEQSTGVRFDQPVLDTLLLSAIIHPQQESHRLEAIAARLGVQVLGRHTALGDALVTAEVFLKMLPLLQEKGILTLGQAMEASRQTRFAKVTY
ncbi:MAG: DNA polymerase III subunit epsilon [Rubrivivax sp.]|nr:DNA polymerase III subunit epsilon [Rubrivivax sp.]